MTEFKKGDRVKVTYEGVVYEVFPQHLSVDCGGYYYGPKRDHPDIRIEKLPDPEPEWGSGAIVRVDGWVPAVRVNGEWINPHGGYSHPFHDQPELLSEAWTSGKVEVLYRGSAR